MEFYATIKKNRGGPMCFNMNHLTGDVKKVRCKSI